MTKQSAGGLCAPRLVTVAQFLDAIAGCEDDAPMTFIADGDQWAVKRVHRGRRRQRGPTSPETLSIATVRSALESLDPRTTVQLLIGDQDWTITGIHTGQRLVIAARQSQGESE